MDGNLFRANRARPGSQKVTVIHKWVYGIEFLSTKLKILHLINNMKLGPQTHFGAKYQSEGNIQLVTKLWNLSSRHRRSRIDFEVLCQQTKTLRRSRILWGNGFRPCQNLIQWKDGWHGRSTLIPCWPLLKTWACPYVSLCLSTWDWWLGPLPRSPGMGEGGDWWSWPMGVIAEGVLRGCQGLFAPVSLGYPLSVFNNKLYSQNKQTKTGDNTPKRNKRRSACGNLVHRVTL